MRSPTVSIASRWAPESFARSVPNGSFGAFIASSRFSNTECFSNTVGFWNLRPIPA